MKIHKFISTSAAAAILACTAGAQQLFGPWWHDTSTQLSLFVSPNGGGSGMSPASPTTLTNAVATADLLFAVNWASTGKGATINVLPGTYTLTQPLSLPAFGFSLEAYFDPAGGTATISGPLGAGQPLFFFDHIIGPWTQQLVGSSAGMPPSIVRGLSFNSNGGGPAVQIDPSSGASDGDTQPIEVQVDQCTMSNCAVGVRITNAAAAQIDYRNVIVDNTIGCFVGIEATNAWFESDLIRSNRITGALNWMRIDGLSGGPGKMHPRILSNMMSNAVNLTEGLFLRDCSARIVNNTMGFVSNGSASPGATPATIRVNSFSGGAGESIVIANNILFSPVYVLAGTVTVDPPEILIQGTFAGTLTVQSNDFDGSGSGTLITPAQPVGPGNVAIGNPQFVSVPPLATDLHLTAASPSLTNPGNMAFVVPGTTATVKVNNVVLPANCALDVDLDPRTHMQSGTLTEVLHRGADQFIETSARLRTATSGPNLQADRFGNVKVPPASPDAVVDLLLDLPVGSAFSIVLGAALPMGPELQHMQVSPFGSIAIDPTPGNGATMVSGFTTVNPQPVAIHLGKVTPGFCEGELYLQALVALPNGVIAPTNRVRLDIDDL